VDFFSFIFPYSLFLYTDIVDVNSKKEKEFGR
jgi:hypothetical protein